MGAQLRGRRQHKVRVQRATETADSFGEPDLTWADIGERWATITPRQGLELRRDGTPYTEQVFLFDMRWDQLLDGLTGKDRLLWGTRLFEVVSVSNVDSANVDLHVLARELG